jgi:phage-related protein
MNGGKVIYHFEGDTKDLEEKSKSIGSTVKGALSGIGKTVGCVFATAFTTATGMITTLTKKAIDSYADLEQNIGGVETLFKNSADKVIKNSQRAYKTAGVSANKYMETVTSFSASLLQSLEGDTEKAVEYSDRAIVDMSDNANKMGTSMEMIQNAYQGFAKQNYTMLDNLKLGKQIKVFRTHTIAQL